MIESITVALPSDIQQALDQESQAEGVSREELVERAVRQHLFLRKFHSLRERLSAKAREQGILTDQDVFDRVS
jgi:metal-responsive CopG/Arc/MetJ family transcriptional regulator